MRIYRRGNIYWCEFQMDKKLITFPKHFLPFFEKRTFIDINLSDTKTYQLQRKLRILDLPKNTGKRESEISFKSLNLEISTLSHFFNHCIEHGYISINPASKIKKLNTLPRLKTLDYRRHTKDA
ncbi:MAG TPA: hypothetical protein ENI54_03020 [bacterium]|nr:hypothetical protein [bacterium]